MLMITTLHVVNQHYNLLNTNLSPSQFVPGYLMEYLCFCGVNCFALLSGYLKCEKKITYDKVFFSNFFNFWIKLIIWGCLILLAIRVSPYRCSFSYWEYFKFLIPMYGHWWYISAYFGLMLFFPVLTAFTANCGKRNLLICSILLVFFCSVMAVFDDGFLRLSEGYSTIWLLVCFMWGAVLKAYEASILRLKYRKLLLTVGISASVLIPFFYHMITTKFFFCCNQGVFMNFISPFCVMEAVFLLIVFRMISIHNKTLKNLIGFLSRNSLGIYLFQCHPCIWRKMIFTHQPSPSLGEMLYLIPAWILGLAIVGVLMNVLVDSFFRFCRFDRLIQWSISRSSKMIVHLIDR